MTSSELGADVAAGVPDVPSAVVGWRTWRVGRRAQQRLSLVGPLSGIGWPAGRPMVATCASPSHTPPGVHCRCGLYAVADPARLEWGPSDHEVLGVVALWGEVVEGAHGWRGAQGYPRFLVTGPAIPDEQRAALARRYRVPVHRSEVPTRALARFLGEDLALADELRYREDATVAARLDARMPGWVRRYEAPVRPAARRRRWWTLAR